jgi:hypothetical protein
MPIPRANYIQFGRERRETAMARSTTTAMRSGPSTIAATDNHPTAVTDPSKASSEVELPAR